MKTVHQFVLPQGNTVGAGPVPALCRRNDRKKTFSLKFQGTIHNEIEMSHSCNRVVAES